MAITKLEIFIRNKAMIVICFSHFFSLYHLCTAVIILWCLESVVVSSAFVPPSLMGVGQTFPV